MTRFYVEYAREKGSDVPTDFEIVSSKTFKKLQRLPWIKIFHSSRWN